MKTIIHWFRRDLRLLDNTSLFQASHDADWVVPVYVFDSDQLQESGFFQGRLQFQLDSIEHLQIHLVERRSKLIFRMGKPEVVLSMLASEVNASAIYCNRVDEPSELSVDEQMRELGKAVGFEYRTFKDAVIHDHREIRTGKGSAYTVYSPFAVKWKSFPKPKPLPRFQGGDSGVWPKNHNLPTWESMGLLQPRREYQRGGEKRGAMLLKTFCAKKLRSYGRDRDYPELNGTSHLSAHLHWGTLSARSVWAEVEKVRKGSPVSIRRNGEIYIQELIWREFFIQLLVEFPYVEKGAFRAQFDRLNWSRDREKFNIWCEGKTGFPLVDAAMRQLEATGWMHNRLRMVVAMFLTKDLHLDWRWGERYFQQKLVDWDLAANNGGWQWCAGTGADAAPYFRIFSPIQQSKKFDPKGDFIRRWIPELASVEAPRIHEPWKMERQDFNRLGYPLPVVDHAQARQKTLDLYGESTK